MFFVQVSPSHLWGLWTNPDGETVLRYATFNASSSDSTTGWNYVTLESPLDPEFAPVDSRVDQRQAYLAQLFHPGRFSIQTLAKTVSVSYKSRHLTPSIARN